MVQMHTDLRIQTGVEALVFDLDGTHGKLSVLHDLSETHSRDSSYLLVPSFHLFQEGAPFRFRRGKTRPSCCYGFANFYHDERRLIFRAPTRLRNLIQDLGFHVGEHEQILIMENNVVEVATHNLL